ncbi:Uncharacterised protein [Mycobacteroides abscessus subsp. abscessus]|nr:Uncharacterised protein [Mycobacteroides abscessus subsp. abscessus]
MPQQPRRHPGARGDSPNGGAVVPLVAELTQCRVPYPGTGGEVLGIRGFHRHMLHDWTIDYTIV